MTIVLYMYCRIRLHDAAIPSSPCRLSSPFVHYIPVRPTTTLSTENAGVIFGLPAKLLKIGTVGVVRVCVHPMHHVTVTKFGMSGAVLANDNQLAP